MIKKDKFYNDKVVQKPWGEEYVIYRDSNKLCITLLNINYKKKTSLHCHPKKKSGFILLEGKAQFQLGLWKKRSEVHSSPSKRMIARGLFHQITSLSKEGLKALEFETPADKNDLVRFKDPYGRAKKSYEGKKFTHKLEDKKIKFKRANIKKKYKYNFVKNKFVIEKHKSFKRIIEAKSNTIFGILGGEIVDYRGQKVLSCGDIVRTDDIKILSKVFKIKKTLSVLKVINKK